MVSLDPQDPAFKWPQAIAFARHKLEINATKSLDVWISKISSSELRAKGCTNISSTQASMLAEKISLFIKLRDMSEVEKALKDFFSPSRTFSVEDGPSDFCDAMCVLADLDRFQTLEAGSHLMSQ